MLVLAALLSGEALAVEGLAWRWEVGQSRRYHLRADVEVIDGFEMNARLNVDAMVNKVEISIVTTCTAKEKAGKNAWSLQCRLDDVAIQAMPLSFAVGRMGPIVAEWEGTLERDATVEVVLDSTGRVRGIDLDGVDTSIDRFERIAIQMQLLVERAFAAFDVHLPKDGADGGTGLWFQRSSEAMLLPSTGGSSGAPEITVSVLAQQDPIVLLSTKGSGTIASGSVSVGGQPRLLVATELEGSAVFDTKAGELLQAQYVSTGVPSASSTVAEARDNARYVQSVTLQRLAPDEPAPKLKPSRELPRP